MRISLDHIFQVIFPRMEVPNQGHSFRTGESLFNSLLGGPVLCLSAL